MSSNVCVYIDTLKDIGRGFDENRTLYKNKKIKIRYFVWTIKKIDWTKKTSKSQSSHYDFSSKS